MLISFSRWWVHERETKTYRAVCVCAFRVRAALRLVDLSAFSDGARMMNEAKKLRAMNRAALLCLLIEAVLFGCLVAGVG